MEELVRGSRGYQGPVTQLLGFEAVWLVSQVPADWGLSPEKCFSGVLGAQDFHSACPRSPRSPRPDSQTHHI